jgi:ATP-dependent Lon protease
VPVEITTQMIETYNGVRKFSYGLAEETNQIGIVTGLAWTQVGGELLNIEAVAVPGKGRQTKTGSLGDVMQESIQAALTFVRSRAAVLGIARDFHEKFDLHVHVPEGATPKDGPSAGIGMCTALVSVLTGIAVRADVAMTGEITLRGQVLPIGGLKEKLLAAQRGGVKNVIIPSENERDLKEIPDNVKENLTIYPVKWMDDVLAIALVNLPEPLVEERASTGTAGRRTGGRNAKRACHRSRSTPRSCLYGRRAADKPALILGICRDTSLQGPDGVGINPREPSGYPTTYL